MTMTMVSTTPIVARKHPLDQQGMISSDDGQYSSFKRGRRGRTEAIRLEAERAPAARDDCLMVFLIMMADL